MLSFEDAQKTVLKQQDKLSEVTLPLKDVLNQVLAQDVQAKVPLPNFDNSAMDGFAVKTNDVKNASEENLVSLKIVEEIWAGKIPEKELRSGECAKIMTGAKVPLGADAVIMKENTNSNDEEMTTFQNVSQGTNIRYRGEEVKLNQKILEKGKRLTPATIGYLASAGVDTVSVYQKPSVTIIPTGTELVPLGTPLNEVQIYESNSYALAAAVSEMGIEASVQAPSKDDKDSLYKVIQEALNESTHVLICGGVSVGDYDYCKTILSDCKVEEFFWKVAQKPGKPLFFGKKENTSVFGLPGNPVSSLFCFYEYVYPALKRSLGYESDVCLEESEATLTTTYKQKPGRTAFLRGSFFYKDGVRQVDLLSSQGSHMMSAFAEANCLVVIPGETEEVQLGESVKIHILPRERIYL